MGNVPLPSDYSTSIPTDWGTRLFGNNPFDNRYNFQPLNYTAPSFDPIKLNPLINSGGASGGSSSSDGAQNFKPWTGLFNESGLSDSILQFLNRVAAGGRNLVNNSFGLEGKGVAKPLDTFMEGFNNPQGVMSGRDAVAKLFFTTPEEHPTLTKVGGIAYDFGTDPSMYIPASWVSKPVQAAASAAKPVISGINTALRGERGLNEAVNVAQETAAQSAAEAFNKALQNQQAEEAVQSAQKGNFSLVDMLNRTPEAQNTFIDTANELALNQTNKGSVPSLFQLNKLNEPVKFPNPEFNPTQYRIANPAERLLQNLFGVAKESGLPAGREYEYLQGLLPTLSSRTGVGLDELIQQSTRTPSQVWSDVLANLASKQTARAAGVEPLPKLNFARSLGNIDKSIPPTITKPFGEVKGIDPLLGYLDKQASKTPNLNIEPFNNKMNGVFDKESLAQQLNNAVRNAKGEAALQVLQQFAENKNLLQSGYSKIQDTLNQLFNLKGVLKGKMPDYYQYMANKEYRTGQMAKEIMDTLGKYSADDLNEFRLARDAGEIGQGHKFEELNKAYDELLNKYTGADVASGLERGTLKNYVPRIPDVDKENLKSVNRAMGSDSLGGFAEDRTDKRTLRQILQDEGRDPYKKDMYEITMARLQKSINAQEARNFINKMVNDGQAVKFENQHKAFASALYNKATTGVYVDPITKETYLMPKQIAKFLNGEKDYSELSQYAQGLDAVNALARRGMLTNPFIHFPHNILTSLPYALSEAGASGWHVLDPRWWKKAKEASPELIDEMERMGVLRPDYMPIGDTAGKDLAHEAETQGMSPIQKWLSDMSYQSKTGGPMERVNDTINTALRPLDALTWKPEHAARIAIYQTAKEMGATPEEAAAIINRNFGTNTKTLTPFEKNVMTRAFTFYPWLKHILTWGTRAMVNHSGIVAKTFGALNDTNNGLSGHGLADNAPGHHLELDTGRKDEKGNEIYVAPYLPILELFKAASEPGKFAYNRLNQGVTTPLNMIYNSQYGPFYDKKIVDQGAVDAGLVNKTAEYMKYPIQRLFSGPSQQVDELTGNTGNDTLRSILSALGFHTSTYSEKGAEYQLRQRQQDAAKAKANDLRQQGIPIPKQLKQQEYGRSKVPFPIQGNNP